MVYYKLLIFIQTSFLQVIAMGPVVQRMLISLKDQLLWQVYLYICIHTYNIHMYTHIHIYTHIHTYVYLMDA